ncbi:ribonuclease H-like domain-containing protein, partial [Tanacetum coccineum]
EGSSSYTDELKYSFFANQSSGPQLDHEDLEQVDEFDLEEMDLKWQVAMISMRLKKFYKNTGRKLQFDAKEPVGFDKTKEEPKALVTIDGEGVDWTGHAEDEQENFALMAYSNSGSNTKVEAQLVCHQQNQLVYEEKIRFMKINLDDKTNVLTYHKKLLADAVKEKEELKTKLEIFQSSFKGLSKLLNSHMSAKDKSGLGYGDQIHEGVLSYENEVLESVFDSRSSDVEDSPVYDRFAKVEGMHAVPPPMTRIYMPPKSDFGIDESNFTYGLKQSKTSESAVNTSDFVSCESNSSVETLEFVPKPAVNEPKAVSKPKVWSDAPIIEEYESDSGDEYVIKPSKEKEKPSFAFVNTVKHVKTPRETVKEQNTCSPSPKADKRDWNGLMSKKLGLGYGFTKKACFVCGSFSHLIRDYDFHEKRMAKQVELNKQKGKGTGQGENRPHMTRNKAYLVEYQDYNGASVAFGGSKGQITGKGIKREYSNARTPQQNGVAERKNMTLIEAARTMLAGSFLPNTFWAEAVSTACYVLNRVLVTKPQNKTPYELITSKIPIITYIRPFRCHVTILNTIDHLGKFEEKSDEGFLVRYSLDSKAFRVYNLETKRVEENLHINFLENKPNVAGKGPNWLFNLDYLTDSMNYQPVTADNKANKTASPKEANHIAGTQDNIDAGNSEMEAEPAQEYFILPLWSSYTSTEDQAFLEELERLKRQEKEANDAAEAFRKEFAQCTEDLLLQAGAARTTSTNTVNTVSTPISTASPSRVFSAGGPDLTNNDQDDSQIPALKEIYDNPSDGIFTNASYNDKGAVADFTNLETTVNVSPIPTSRIHSIHPTTQIL